ncbi:hypothetical protein DFQ26_000227 [Actinomortierella ambigua]|nr:hypothetical protein DFQ26_000227 [Actinomortierella ambigua]
MKHYFNEPLYLNESTVPEGTPLLGEHSVHIGRSKKKRRTVRSVNLETLLRDVMEDKSGRKALEVPCGKTTMEQALKAILKLNDLQRQRPTNPNMANFQLGDKIREMPVPPKSCKWF